MAAKKPDPKKQDTQQTPPPSDNVEQIREILFGHQIRAVEERFAMVEKRMVTDSENLQKTLENRILELETALDKFRDNTSDKFNREGAEREAGLNQLSKALADFRLDAENQMAELQSDFNNEIKQVRQEILALQTAQTKRSDQLDASKVDRNELSDLFSEVAKRLLPPTEKRGK